MTPFQLSLLGINLAMVIAILTIAVYFVRSYNVLVRLGAPYTPAPAREDRVEISVKFHEINSNRELWRRAGYSVVSSQRRGENVAIIMTKRMNGTR